MGAVGEDEAVMYEGRRADALLDPDGSVLDEVRHVFVNPCSLAQ